MDNQENDIGYLKFKAKEAEMMLDFLMKIIEPTNNQTTTAAEDTGERDE